MATFILKKDASKNYYWIIKSDNNGRIIARSSESYETRASVNESISWVKVNAAKAGIVDMSS